MDNRVLDILSRFMPERPFVWQMRLTEQDFCALENAVDGLEVVDKPTAQCALIYVAEWYKRRYNGTNDCRLDSSQYQRACELSGIDCDRYIYRSADGKTRLWFLSMRLLGGLAAMKECRNKRLLKKLFQLFRNELDDFTMGIIENEQEAAIFKESVVQCGSLYHFFEAISRHEQIYAEEDLADPSSAPAQLYRSIEQVYDEVLRDKFEIEWLVDYPPCSPMLHRSLRLWLRPEEKGSCNEYLRLDRTNHWTGIGDLRHVCRLSVSLRFVDESGTQVGEAPKVVNFENTGQESTGFIATGIHPYGLVKNVPTANFSKIEVMISADGVNPIKVQSIECPGYAQLWLSADCPSRWSSRQRQQAPTAVVFNDAWSLVGCSPDAMLPFTDRRYGASDLWSWKEIAQSNVLSNGTKKITFWNREGYLQIGTHLHPETIIYDGGKVEHFYTESSEFEDDEADACKKVPCIFSRSDIEIRKFAVRNFDLTDNYELMSPEDIYFRPLGARLYTLWDDSVNPPFGMLDLRLIAKGREYFLTTAYLPAIDNDKPIVRDLMTSEIEYRDIDGNLVREKIDVDTAPIEIPAVQLKFGLPSDYIQLDVIKPTDVKEIYVDGKFVKRVGQDKYELPYILKDRATIHDFSAEGYIDYDCRRLEGFYGGYKASPDEWRQGIEKEAVNLDTNAPTGLSVVYGAKPKAIPEDDIPFVYWNYSTDSEPKNVCYDFGKMDDYSILFQDMRAPRVQCIYPKMEEYYDDWENPINISLADCFEKAVKYRSYFFIFNPLYNMTQTQFKTFCESYSGRQEYESALKRLAEELGFKYE